MIHKRKTIILSLFLLMLGLTFLDWSCQRSDPAALPVVAEHYNGSRYAGSETCQSCHAEVWSDHLRTAHHQTSAPASEENIDGSFAPDSNEVRVSDGIFYRMMKEDNVLYQAAYVDGHAMRKAPFDIVIGSGTKGQTYLYWSEEELRQLPISYQTAGDQWILSPGYRDNEIDFNRAAIPTCLSCHMTFAKSQEPENFFKNTYDRGQIILGLDCESCHGPSWEHANFHLQHPEEKEAQNMLAITSLDRQQRLDACAKCHSGLRNPKKAPFSFMTGDTLDNYSVAGYSPTRTETLDVHGNQYGLLTASACFQFSQEMDCSTCHNPHQNQRGDLLTFSQKCMSCHPDGKACKMEAELGSVITKNCIDCHMPELPSSTLMMQNTTTGQIDSARIRTHRVAVYEISEDLKEYIKGL